MGPKQVVSGMLGRMGIEVRRRRAGSEPTIPDSYVHLDEIRAGLESVPGMISTERGVAHYLMAYCQDLRGDIIEVGSWQGRNTCFLAAGCRDSGNGIVHAIDHFQGNPGKRDFYVVGSSDLSDLEMGFLSNIAAQDLSDWVMLHAADAVTVRIDGPVRLLFIDGDHSEQAVRRDLERFAPHVVPGGLVLFDDYSPEFPGVVAAAQTWVSAVGATAVQWRHSLIAKVPDTPSDATATPSMSS